MIIIPTWLQPEPLFATQFFAVPSHVDDDGIIHFHDACELHNLDFIAERLEQRYANSVPMDSDGNWTVCRPCIARSNSKNKFYRAVVKAVNEEERTCFVHYVDYGNEETVPFSSMRKNLDLYKVPVQAYKCTLGNVKPARGEDWDKESIDHIHNLIYNRRCIMKVVGDRLGDILVVDMKVSVTSMSDPKLRLSEQLVQYGIAAFTDDSARIEHPPTESIPMYPKREFASDHFVCTVSAISNDKSELILKPEHVGTAMQELHDDIQEKAPRMPYVNGIYENKACVALYPGDTKWYRATIIHYCGELRQFKVQYTDFGDTWMIDIFDVREAVEAWTKIPIDAVKAKLYGVSHDAELIDADEFFGIFADKVLNAKIIERDLNFIYVELREGLSGEPLVYQHLIDRKALKLGSDD